MKLIIVSSGVFVSSPVSSTLFERPDLTTYGCLTFTWNLSYFCLPSFRCFQEPESDPNRLKNIEDINNTGSQDAQQGAQGVAEKTELGDLGKQSERSNAGGVERGDAKMGNKNLTSIKAAGVQTGEREPNVEQQEGGLANSEQQASEGELSGNCCINCSNLLQLLI